MAVARRPPVSYERLTPTNLVTFTGGLNLRRNQFELADTESPDLLNVDIDPRGGFYTRKGWQRWNAANIVDPAVVVWKPRHAALHNFSNGDQLVLTVNGSTIYQAGQDGVFTALAGPTPAAAPHLADFTSWGDDLYIACGKSSVTYRRNGTAGTVTPMGESFSEVVSPILNMVPKAEFVESHAGYLFIANTHESITDYPNRIRWSHPNHPDAFQTLDLIDIKAGGGKITGIMSFQDHLLIFKSNTIWALFGYDSTSWQLVQVSNSVGCPGLSAVTRSETTVYFYSASGKGGIYAYQGGQPVYISEKIRPAMEMIANYQNVFVSWANRRLWVSVPWDKRFGIVTDPATTFVFDPDVGDGAWTMYRNDAGSVATVIDGSDINTKFPLASFWSTTSAAMLILDSIDDAYDVTVVGAPTGTGFEAYYRTPWLHGGWPDRMKSWRRPSLIVRRVPHAITLTVEQFRDYDDATTRRQYEVEVDADATTIWATTGHLTLHGFDWEALGADDPLGADWGAARTGSAIVRGGPMGHCRALQMRIRASSTTAKVRWGIDGIIIKTTTQRFRT